MLFGIYPSNNMVLMVDVQLMQCVVMVDVEISAEIQYAPSQIFG
jgi:hypothetical protein